MDAAAVAMSGMSGEHLCTETEISGISPLSLHDALPIFDAASRTAIVEGGVLWKEFNREAQLHGLAVTGGVIRSEEHTSELQSHSDLVCRLLLEKKKSLPATGERRRPRAKRAPLTPRPSA